MANFSVNQVRQFYVLNGEYAETVTAASNNGTIGGLKEIKGLLGPEVMFFYKGADNETVLPSDIIPLKNITYAKAYAAANLATKMRKVKVTLAITPTAGQDCVLGINFKNFFSSGDASQYYKDAAVHVTSAMVSDVKEFYKAMVAELNACFSREDGATATTNPYLTFSAGTAGSEDGIYIEEKPQAWKLGTMKARRIMFDVLPGTVLDNGDDVIWGTVAEQTPTTTVNNGQQIADLEWFCAGERGDQYRMKGWPNYVHTDYLVDPTQAYNVLEIHYAFTDTGVNSYRTEKEITIVAKTAAHLTSFITAFNALDSVEAAGFAIEGLS